MRDMVGDRRRSRLRVELDERAVHVHGQRERELGRGGPQVDVRLQVLLHLPDLVVLRDGPAEERLAAVDQPATLLGAEN